MRPPEKIGQAKLGPRVKRMLPVSTSSAAARDRVPMPPISEKRGSRSGGRDADLGRGRGQLALRPAHVRRRRRSCERTLATMVAGVSGTGA